MGMRRNPGKFDTPLDEAIYAVSLDGGPDEEAGSSSEPPYTWAGIMKDGRELAKAIRDRRAELPHVTDTDLEFLRSDGSAGVILTEDSSGFVKVKYYASERDLNKDWAEVEESLNVGDDLEPNRRRRTARSGRRRRGRMSPNSTIAERRARGEIEGLTRAEMDSMEIRIPTFGWKQVDGDMNPGAHGGTIAEADGDRIELIKIQPVREYVGDDEAKDTGFPFWSKEGYYDLDDLQLSNEGVQSAIEYTGLGEHLLDMTPEERAVAIAVACMDAGYRTDEGPGGWAKDVLGGRVVQWSSGDTAGYEHIADEDDEFRREILGEEDEDEDEELEPNRRRRHTRNPKSWPTLMQGNDVMSELVDMRAETLDPSGRGVVPSEVSGEISYTDEFVEKVFAYENALKEALEEVVERWPPLDEATADELFDDEAPFLVLMTLEGHGVGIWDGSWDKHFDRNQIEKVQAFLKQKLRKYADGSGSGSLPEAMDELVYEAMRRAEYGFTDDGYAPLSEGGVLDVDFKENRRRPKGGSRFRGNGNYSLDFKLGVTTPNPTPNSSRVRWHVFLGDDLVDTVYMPPGLSAAAVKRELVSQGSNPNITVDQPPERRSALPPHYQMRPNRTWTRAYINTLPDSAFLYIEPGGTKDDDGKTVPRSLRHFPYRSRTGEVDIHHLNNARARIGNSHVSEAAKREAFEKSERALAQAR